MSYLCHFNISVDIDKNLSWQNLLKKFKLQNQIFIKFKERNNSEKKNVLNFFLLKKIGKARRVLPVQVV